MLKSHVVCVGWVTESITVFRWWACIWTTGSWTGAWALAWCSSMPSSYSAPSFLDRCEAMYLPPLNCVTGSLFPEAKKRLGLYLWGKALNTQVFDSRATVAQWLERSSMDGSPLQLVHTDMSVGNTLHLPCLCMHVVVATDWQPRSRQSAQGSCDHIQYVTKQHWVWRVSE